jgi:hypothetical protein
MPRFPLVSDFLEYAVDAAQRNVLFWDTLRQRGNEYRRRNAAGRGAVQRLGGLRRLRQCRVWVGHRFE